MKKLSELGKPGKKIVLNGIAGSKLAMMLIYVDERRLEKRFEKSFSKFTKMNVFFREVSGILEKDEELKDFLEDKHFERGRVPLPSYAHPRGDIEHEIAASIVHGAVKLLHLPTDGKNGKIKKILSGPTSHGSVIVQVGTGKENNCVVSVVIEDERPTLEDALAFTEIADRLLSFEGVAIRGRSCSHGKPMLDFVLPVKVEGNSIPPDLRFLF